MLKELKSIEIDGQYKCVSCDFISTNKKSVSGHWWRFHTEKGRNHKSTVIATNNGNGRDYLKSPIWNKGLTKETDTRIEKIAKTYSERIKFGINTAGFKGKHHTPETKQIISKKLSVNNKGGRCKWFNVDGQSVQGTMEKAVAEKLSLLRVRWIKLKVNRDTLEYIINGVIRHYTPDFYLPDYNIYLEVKGFWLGNSKEKMAIVKETHLDKNIQIIEGEDYLETLEKILGL
jgi:hypothetical protein